MEGWRQCSSSDGLGWLRAGLPSKKQQTIGPTFLSSGMVPERSSPSRVRCAAQNAPLTAPGRSEKPAAKKGRWNFRKANLTATGLLMEGALEIRKLLILKTLETIETQDMRIFGKPQVHEISIWPNTVCQSTLSHIMRTIRQAQNQPHCCRRVLSPRIYSDFAIILC